MKVKRIVFINKAPIGNIDLDFSDKKVISLTGINGSGKTTILSYIADAFYELAKLSFDNEFSGSKKDKYYRIISSLYNTTGKNSSLVYISFDNNGEDIHYVELIGITSKEIFNELMSRIWEGLEEKKWPIKYNDISSHLQHGIHSVKFLKIDETDDSKNVFQNNILTYFPSYRYEQPGYLNDIYQIELSHRTTSDVSGYLPNPIEVTSDLPQIANWLLDLVLDMGLYGSSEAVVKQKIDNIISNILLNKLNNKVRIGIGQRYLGGARIQVYDDENKVSIYPSIFSISAGEASLLCIFGELVKQADKIGKSGDISNIEGIVIVDEVDKHLHIKLQKEVLPVLIKMFPKIQFILSTHSPFVNLGLSDTFMNSCCIIDLDSGGRECNSSENEVFREAYDIMVGENERYINLCNELRQRLKDMTKPIVYLEGETDEKYFNKALEIFGYKDENIEFRQIGCTRENGKKVEFTGASNMNKARDFFKANKPAFPQIFLYDCDTKEQDFNDENIIVMRMPKYDNSCDMDKGIENALILDDLDISQFYSSEKKGSYGCKIEEFHKMKMCDFICNLDTKTQKKILSNLKIKIEDIINRLKK